MKTSNDIVLESVVNNTKINREKIVSEQKPIDYIKYFNNIFKNNEKNHAVILTHDNPDPDALASAMAVREICDQIFDLN